MFSETIEDLWGAVPLLIPNKDGDKLFWKGADGVEYTITREAELLAFSITIHREGRVQARISTVRQAGMTRSDFDTAALSFKCWESGVGNASRDLAEIETIVKLYCKYMQLDPETFLVRVGEGVLEEHVYEIRRRLGEGVEISTWIPLAVNAKAIQIAMKGLT